MFVFDAHVDTLSRLVDLKETLETSDGHVNLTQLRKTPQAAQFFAAFVSPKYYQGMAMHRTIEMIDQFWQMLADFPNDLAYAGSAKEIKKIRKTSRLACLLAIEGGEALEGTLSSLRIFYQLGVRLLTLTWNHRNQLASGQLEGDQGGGLSIFGRQVVTEMNKLGMLIDVSHLNDPGFWDVLALSKSPVIASHSNARALCDHPRNLTDEQIKALADSGGVIGVNFYPYFLSKSGEATVEHVLDHIEYLLKVGGTDCVALGSDFDGISLTPKGLEHWGKTSSLITLLEKRGYTEAIIQKIMGDNLLRVCQEVLD